MADLEQVGTEHRRPSVSKEGHTLVLRSADGTPRWPLATADDLTAAAFLHDPVR